MPAGGAPTWWSTTPREDFVEIAREATGGRGVDLVLESVGGDVLSGSLDALRPSGRLVSVGASSGHSTKRFRLHTLFELGITVSGFTLGTWLEHTPELVTPSVDRVLAELARGTVRPVVGRVFAQPRRRPRPTKEIPRCPTVGRAHRHRPRRPQE